MAMDYDKLCKIFDDLNLGLYIYEIQDINDDRTLYLRAANRKSEEYTGVCAADSLNRTLDEIFPFLREQGIPQKYADSIRNQKHLYLGEIFYQDKRVKPAYYDVNTFILSKNSLGVVFSNVTEQEKIKQQSMENAAKFQSIFDKSADGIILADIQTKKFVECNEMASQMLGYKKSEFVQLSVRDIHPPDQLDFVLMQFKRQAKKEIRMAENLPVVRKDGTIFYADINSTPIEINGKKYLMGTFRDVTEKNQLQDQLVHSEKLAAVGQMAGSIAHEFNNILAINYMNNLALESTIRDRMNTLYPEIEKYFQKINNAIIRGKSIVDSITLMAKPQPLQKNFYFIHKIMEEVIKLQEYQLRIENINIQTDYNKVPKAFIDKGRFEQVFLNLIINARHAIIPKGQGNIKLSVKTENDNIVITVSDDGIGMDEETLQKIFTPFFTTKGAFAKDNFGIKGTGLGLSITYSIIKQHEGIITVESEKGRGTSFIIKLPVYREILTKTDEVIEENKIYKRTKRIKVLLVDDEIDFIETLQEVMENLNCEVKAAVNGRDACKFAKQGKFDLILLDILLPDMSGKEIFNELKKITPRIPVVFMSGQIGLEYDSLKQMGASGLLRKPFGIEELEKLINTICN